MARRQFAFRSRQESKIENRSGRLLLGQSLAAEFAFWHPAIMSRAGGRRKIALVEDNAKSRRFNWKLPQSRCAPNES
jgi:hypothetical protein